MLFVCRVSNSQILNISDYAGLSASFYYKHEELPGLYLLSKKEENYFCFLYFPEILGEMSYRALYFGIRCVCRIINHFFTELLY